MKALIKMTEYISIVLIMMTGIVFIAYGGVSGNSPGKEKEKKSGWIGVMVQDVNKKIARKAKLDSEEGAYVNEVVDESPADTAGIKEGDVIIEFYGKKLFDADDLAKAVRRTAPGIKVNLLLIRDGEKKTLSLIVGKHKETKHSMFGFMPHMPDLHIFSGNYIIGLKLLKLNEQLGEYFGAPNNEGVLVEEVEKESAAEKAGFKAGDIIIRIGKKTIYEVEKIQRELEKYDEGDKAEFEVLRKGAKKVLSVEIEEERSIQRNFFFGKPHIQMFPTDPFDDTGMHLEMDCPLLLNCR